MSACKGTLIPENIDLNRILLLARAAGQAILDIYAQADAGVEQKADCSPLTQADRAAHQCIQCGLTDIGLPILSEEGRTIPWAERQHWERFWLVDPLDGTREFLKRNGEFTVNIALIAAQQPVWGVIYVPVQDILYWGGPGLGAFCQQGNTPPVVLQTQSKPLNSSGIRVVASRSHLNAETEAFIQGLIEPQLVSMGSSLKFMLLAEGRADVYPRFAPTMEWDTAAADAILRAAGGQVIQADSGEPLRYNKENLVNPWFLARA